MFRQYERLVVTRSRTLLSGGTLNPELLLFVFNDFPAINHSVVAPESWIVAPKSRTEFHLKFVRVLNAKASGSQPGICAVLDADRCSTRKLNVDLLLHAGHTREAWTDPDIRTMYIEANKWSLGMTDGSTVSHPTLPAK